MNGKDKNNRTINVPGIGMRIIKSSIAVAVCFVIDYLRGEGGMVFYSQLAALWCIQMYRSNTIRNAIQRIIGTLVGAVYGLIYLLSYSHMIREGTSYVVAETITVSLLIIFILYTTVLMKKPQASYFSCVVFLSIVINHATDVNPYMFVWNRFLDTMIGILVGVIINDFRICLHPNRDTLFVSGLDEVLLDRRESLSQFSKVELNRMIDDGMNFTVSTMRTPASIIEIMKDVRLTLPVIAMNGAALYDMQNYSYIKVYVIPSLTAKKVMGLIKSENMCGYANVIIDDMLVIYYDEVEDEINRGLVKKLRTSPFRNYVNRPLPEGESVVYFMILDRKDRVEAFNKKLEISGIADQLEVISYDSNDYPGYAYIKIYSKNATKENMLDYIKEYSGIENVVTFGSIPHQYDVYIDTYDVNRVVREVRKRYEPIIRNPKK